MALTTFSLHFYKIQIDQQQLFNEHGFLQLLVLLIKQGM